MQLPDNHHNQAPVVTLSFGKTIPILIQISLHFYI